MRPLPMTITFFIALWLEDVLKNAEIAAKFFRNNGCLRGWTDDSFEAVHWKREAMVSVTHNSMNGRRKIGEGLETNGQCPFFAQDSQSYRRLVGKKKHAWRCMNRIRPTVTNIERYENALLDYVVLLCSDPGGHFRNFLVVMCRWDPGTLSLCQS